MGGMASKPFARGGGEFHVEGCLEVEVHFWYILVGLESLFELLYDMLVCILIYICSIYDIYIYYNHSIYIYIIHYMFTHIYICIYIYS